MINNQSLRDAVPKVLELLEKYQYSKNYTNELRRHFRHVVDLYEEFGITNFKEGQYQLLLSHIEKEYEDKKIRSDLFWFYRKCAYYLDEYFRTGEIYPTILVHCND